MLDQVIGEFDDGFLSDADTVRSKRKDPRGQFGFNDKIDQIFDEIYEDSKVERLDNFKISSSGPDKGAADADGHEKTSSTEIPAPGTVQAAKRQYLDNLDRNHLDRDRERSRIPDSKVQRASGSDTRHSVVSSAKTRKSETNAVRRENKSGELDSETGVSLARPHGSAETKCHQVGSDHLLPS